MTTLIQLVTDTSPIYEPHIVKWAWLEASVGGVMVSLILCLLAGMVLGHAMVRDSSTLKTLGWYVLLVAPSIWQGIVLFQGDSLFETVGAVAFIISAVVMTLIGLIGRALLR
ncbi:hypothetical protein [Pedococcus soli]